MLAHEQQQETAMEHKLAEAKKADQAAKARTQQAERQEKALHRNMQKVVKLASQEKTKEEASIARAVHLNNTACSQRSGISAYSHRE